jgi:excisionase family DNA binding protein
MEKIKSSLGGSNKLLTMHEAAELLGIPYSSLRRYRRKWGLREAEVNFGRSVKFRERDLAAFIERGRP